MASKNKEMQFENWMSELPASLQSKPLTRLSIPGSHKSYTYNLKPFAELDGPAPCCAHCLALCCGCVGRGRVYRWSMTQSKEVFDQLCMGIRYFDLQVIFRKITNDFFCINGMYAMRVSEFLDDLVQFLMTHKKEVVILDFNQFNNFKKDDLHERLNQQFDDILRTLIIDYQDIASLTLQKLWDIQKQVVIIYGHEAVGKLAYSHLFPDKVINRQTILTTKASRMIHHLETKFNSKGSGDTLTVWPGYLTPTSATIAGKLCGSIEGSLAPKAGRAFIDWIESKNGQNANKINVCCMDFIEMPGFVSAVLSLNKG